MTGMKANTIKIIIRKKLTNIAKSIEDSEIRGLFETNAIVSGGAITSMLLGEEINDYDIYFRTKEAAKAIAEYYVEQFNKMKPELKSPTFSNTTPVVKEEKRINIKGQEEDRIVIYIKSAGIVSETQEEYQYFETLTETKANEFVESAFSYEDEEVIKDIKNLNSYRPVFFSDNAITLKNKTQLVIRFFGNPEEIHKNYDFVHCMCYYDFWKDSLVLPQEALESILSKSLVYKGSLYPFASLFRIRKFIARGWRITAGQMLKIIWQIGEIDFKNTNMIYEQLIGVDQAYMRELIQAIDKGDVKNIDSTYIAKLVDEIFE
jgi:hypothetical protein